MSIFDPKIFDPRIFQTADPIVVTPPDPVKPRKEGTPINAYKQFKFIHDGQTYYKKPDGGSFGN